MPALGLKIELGDVRRQQPVKIECVALVLGEGGAFVEKRIVEELITAERGFDVIASRVWHRR